MDADCSGVGRVICMDQLGLVVVLVAKPWTQLVSSTRISTRSLIQGRSSRSFLLVTLGVASSDPALSVILVCDSEGGKFGPVITAKWGVRKPLNGTIKVTLHYNQIPKLISCPVMTRSTKTAAAEELMYEGCS